MEPEGNDIVRTAELPKYLEDPAGARRQAINALESRAEESARPELETRFRAHGALTCNVAELSDHK
jgi:hypothetical protein